MHGGPGGPERLNPRKLLERLRQLVSKQGESLDEVFVRRIISALFFALFNYWAAKAYAGGRRGTGPQGDSFQMSEFLEDMAAMGLDHAAYSLFIYRVGVDHYILNPATVALTGGASEAPGEASSD